MPPNHTATQTGGYAFDVFESGPTAPPSLVLTLTGCAICHPGDPFTVQALLKNPGPVGVPIELKLGLRLPDGSAANLFGASGEHLVVPLPAALNAPFTLMNIPWPGGPAETWSIEATVLEVALGKAFSRDVKTFQAAP